MRLGYCTFNMLLHQCWIWLNNNTILFPDRDDNCWKRAWPEYQFWLEPNSRKWTRSWTDIWTWLHWTCQSGKQVAFVPVEFCWRNCIYSMLSWFAILFSCSCYMAATMQVVFSTHSFYSGLVYIIYFHEKVIN